jgi:hypothetical protein
MHCAPPPRAKGFISPTLYSEDKVSCNKEGIRQKYLQL